MLCGDTISGDDAAAVTKKAKRQLFGLILGEIGDQNVTAYLTKNHDDDGKAALDYIMGCFGAGTDELKLKSIDYEYKKYEREGIPPNATVDQANKIITMMSNIHSQLKDKTADGFTISDQRHVRNIIYMVERRGSEYEHELRMQQDRFDEATLRNVPKAAGILDSIMRHVERKMELKAEDDDKRFRVMLVEQGICAPNEVDVLHVGRPAFHRCVSGQVAL